MTYNGYKNYETWNIALWLGNDEGLYKLVINYGKEVSYKDFAEIYLAEFSDSTPDGVKWLDESLDYEKLDEVLEELG